VCKFNVEIEILKNITFEGFGELSTRYGEGQKTSLIINIKNIA
jgi:hypothetical protein